MNLINMKLMSNIVSPRVIVQRKHWNPNFKGEDSSIKSFKLIKDEIIKMCNAVYQVLFAYEEALKVRICVDKVSRELGWAGITGWGFIFIFLLYPTPSFEHHSHHHLYISSTHLIEFCNCTHPQLSISSDYFIFSCTLLFSCRQNFSSFAQNILV